VFLSFLEHYPYTRALCLAANNKLDIISMQHASYSHGKTFYYLDPNHEFVSSEIDGLILPHPNQIIIMGNRNKALFESVGYKSDDVLQYGSLRYKDKSEIINSHTKVINNDSFNILLPLSIKESIHVDLIMAVYTAIKGILNVRVIIRNHPYHNIRDNYWVMTNLNLENFQFSENTLLDDLNNSDLIISSYSTVAEEGLLMGIPVIQWASLDFEGSPLFCDPRVSTVSNVIELRNTIKKIIQNYEQYKPSLTTIDEIYADYFSPSHNSNTLISNYIESKI
jgi:CDP-glycerol glycerophosphotransferase (TagB/SpsB family)